MSREVNVSAAVAPSGWSVYWIFAVSPTFTVSDSTVILVAGTMGFAFTVTEHSAFTFGSSVVTSITTLPSFTPVTLPLASTVAISVSREVNVSAAVAPSGWSVYWIFAVSPTFTVSGLIVISVSCIDSTTFTTLVASTPSHVAATVTSPIAVPLNSPVAGSMVATVPSLILHVTVVSEGSTPGVSDASSALSCRVASRLHCAGSGRMVIVFTAIFLPTVTWHVAVSDGFA